MMIPLTAIFVSRELSGRESFTAVIHGPMAHPGGRQTHVPGEIPRYFRSRNAKVAKALPLGCQDALDLAWSRTLWNPSKFFKSVIPISFLVSAFGFAIL